MITHRDGRPLYDHWEKRSGYLEELAGFRVGDYVEYEGTGASRHFDPDLPDGEWNHRGWIWRLGIDPHEGAYAVVAQHCRDCTAEEWNHCFQTLIVRVFTLDHYRKLTVLDTLATMLSSPRPRRPQTHTQATY